MFEFLFCRFWLQHAPFSKTVHKCACGTDFFIGTVSYYSPSTCWKFLVGSKLFLLHSFLLLAPRIVNTRWLNEGRNTLLKGPGKTSELQRWHLNVMLRYNFEMLWVENRIARWTQILHETYLHLTLFIWHPVFLLAESSTPKEGEWVIEHTLACDKPFQP